MANFIEKVFEKLSILPKKIVGFNQAEPLTAERAWLVASYGNGKHGNIQERIKEKQKEIDLTIMDHVNNCVISRGGYGCLFYCTINIGKDIIKYADEIVAPFKDRGFVVVNLSERISEFDIEGTYLISWSNIFDGVELKTNN